MGLTVLLVVVAVMLAAEAVRALTVARHPLARRWLGNVTLYACCILMLKLLVPAYAAAGAIFAAEHGLGLFHAVAAPIWLVALVTFAVLDFVGYLTHRIEHAVPLLWRMHRVHHSDPDLDLTTGLRFHPLEVLVRGSVAAVVMALLGAPVAVVALCSLVYGMVSLVSHVNAPLLPARADRVLRALLVTPRVHRIHHSLEIPESNSNFGVALSIWDRMLGTYRAEPRVPFEQMRFGVEERTTDDSLSIGKMLVDPVRA
jgi:sterol desaturase/sphingolipid hydroxylase (fatty acid hydroxylase superfamily)